MTEIDICRLSKIERINAVGTSGSGKSTLSRQLAQQLGLTFTEMDNIYWGPSWQEPTEEDFALKVKAITESSHWVLDGNYSRTTPVKWRQVQLVVWLDLSFTRTVFRVLSRSIKRILTRQKFGQTLAIARLCRKCFSPENLSSFGQSPASSKTDSDTQG